MEILMIGNGFDIEHGLPTKYADFLQFAGRYNEAYTMAHMTPSEIPSIEDEYLKFIFESPETNVDEALHQYLENNIWVDHFQNAYKEHLANKENWIDFESEISSVIQKLDRLQQAYLDKYSDFYKGRVQQCISELPGVFINQFTYEQGVSACIPVILRDLDRLIGALEIYIYDYIDNWLRIEYYNPDIDAIHPDAVLSFNYSNTRQRVYAYNRTNVKYNFIHGKAQSTPYTFYMDECIDKNKMVLRIDEYLPDDRKGNEVDFIAFKKYYQRIYKKTGNGYKSWLSEIDKRRKESRNEENRLYIFGHSLDVTDGDVLKELMEHDGIQTVIFYRDKARLGQQIANLVKVFGPDKVIKYVYGNSPTIEFRQQKDREKIHGSAFEITSDIVKLEHFYKYKGEELEDMVTKLKKKIEAKELGYFCSQETVISLYDVLQRYGLGARYGKQLLEIADSLKETKLMKEPVQFQYQRWEYQDYDNSYGCDRSTKKFIDLVNEHNRRNFVMDDFLANVTSWNDIIENYWKIANGEEKIGKERYIEIVKDVLTMHRYSFGNMDDMWKLLLRLSVGAADKISREALKELVQKAEKSWEICSYTYLLREIEICDYFSEVAESMPEEWE